WVRPKKCACTSAPAEQSAASTKVQRRARAAWPAASAFFPAPSVRETWRTITVGSAAVAGRDARKIRAMMAAARPLISEPKARLMTKLKAGRVTPTSTIATVEISTFERSEEGIDSRRRRLYSLCGTTSSMLLHENKTLRQVWGLVETGNLLLLKLALKNRA